MKNQIFRGLTILSFFSTLAVAQVFPPTPGDLKVSIPFKFRAGDKTMPPGNYIVHKTDAADVLQICEDGIHCATVATTDMGPRETSRQPRLVFRQYGDENFLCQVRLSSEIRRCVAGSRLELETSKSGTEPKFASLDAQLLCIHFENGMPTSWP